MERRRPSVNRKTTSLVDEAEGFYGRDADKRAIIDMLISDDDEGSNPSVIPIVGMGGVGKTTLAQHLYNDKEVEKRFKIRVWVCVSDQFDEIEVTKEILKKVTREACHYNDLDLLQCELKKALNGEKFLLVLDNVWTEDYEDWRRLLIPLRSGAKGSKIIVTTRSKKVASKAQTVPSHDLRELEYEDCWKVFARHACLDVKSTANHRELQEIGKQIARKCGGLPLAARALGGVLRWETKAENWKEVLKSEIWDVRNANILPALGMSYIHLPSHLKRCFAYCAIFPRDYEFQKEELVALWISEGFLVQRRGNQSLEEIGDMYFDDLVSRSFFQRKDDFWGGPSFVMHDLVHDLARFVSGEFCSRLEGGTSQKIGERTRHVSYEDTSTKFQGTHETPFLRSFVLPQQSWVSCSPGCRSCFDEVIDGLLLKRKLLRVLCLSCHGIWSLPNSIDNLKHLRHLDLSKTSIILLPEAVTVLLNLEILNLRYCKNLVELPADMARLINLCQLDLRGTKNLKGMPPEMGKLKKLSKLSDFVVRENGGSSIKELGHLHYLRGRILIRGLQTVNDDWDASEAILKDKENLKTLELEWQRNADDSRQVKQVLERLQPHTHIESIWIKGYRGTKFPNWIADISFSKLKELYLRGCENCIWLPPLGQLASLEELSIDGDAAVEAIGVEFYGKCKQGEKPFSSLKRLEFIGMKKWREWSSLNGAFPVLKVLNLRDCPALMSVPSHLPSLKLLNICGCPELLSIPTHLPSLKGLWIIGMKKWREWSSFNGAFSVLEELELRNCPELMSVPTHLPSLKRIQIIGMRRWKEWSSFNGALPVLEELELRDCPELMSVPTHLPSLKRLWIEGCYNCISLALETFTNLEKLDVCGCYYLESLVGSTAAATTTTRTSDPLFSCSLTSLNISGSSKLVSFPRGGLRAPNLKRMRIERCRNLKSLPQGMHSLLPSLEDLSISCCPEIESFPEGGLPSKLQSLEVILCEKLVAGRMQWGLQSLPTLWKIIISSKSCEEVGSSFPEETLLPSSLQSLKISGFARMRSLNYKGLEHLSSLQYLEISDCMSLESLRREELPASLSLLHIVGSPLLEKRPKIKHLPPLELSIQEPNMWASIWASIWQQVTKKRVVLVLSIFILVMAFGKQHASQ